MVVSTRRINPAGVDSGAKHALDAHQPSPKVSRDMRKLMIDANPALGGTVSRKRKRQSSLPQDDNVTSAADSIVVSTLR